MYKAFPLLENEKNEKKNLVIKRIFCEKEFILNFCKEQTVLLKSLKYKKFIQTTTNMLWSLVSVSLITILKYALNVVCINQNCYTIYVYSEGNILAKQTINI